jgi:hypothetical protein
MVYVIGKRPKARLPFIGDIGLLAHLFPYTEKGMISTIHDRSK